MIHEANPIWEQIRRAMLEVKKSKRDNSYIRAMNEKDIKCNPKTLPTL